MLTYRRPLLAILHHIFKLLGRGENQLFSNQKEATAAKLNTLFELSGAVRSELLLAAVLAPLAVTNVAASFTEKLYAMDASPSMGAVVSSQPAPGTTKVLWRCAEKRGGYSRVEPGPRAVRREGGWLDPDDERDAFEDAGLPPPERPLAMFYDFAEITGGAGVVSRAVAQRGRLVGPEVDLSCSR